METPLEPKTMYKSALLARARVNYWIFWIEICVVCAVLKAIVNPTDSMWTPLKRTATTNINIFFRISGGMVLQTNMSDILARIEDQNRLVKQEAGLSAAPAAVVHQLKSMNLPQQFKDMKLPDLPQAIKVINLGSKIKLMFAFANFKRCCNWLKD